MTITRRRFLATTTAAAASSYALSGCGVGTANNRGIAFAWWGSGPRNTKTLGVVDLFEKAHDIDIKPRPTGDFDAYWEKLTIESTGHSAPCVVQMQTRYMSDYSERDALRPLDELVDNGTIDVSGMPKAILATGRGGDGRLYSVPTGVFFYASYHNRKLAHEHGIAAPPVDWDWPAWEKWLRDAAKRLPKGVYAADLYPATDFSGPFFNYVIGHGKRVFGKNRLGFDEALLADWWELWDELRKDGIVTPGESLGGRSDSIEQLPISVGEVLWNSQPHNQLVQVNEVTTAAKLGVVELRKLPNGPAGAGENLGTNGLSITTSCTRREVRGAASFVDFFLNDDAAATVYASDNGTVTVRELLDAQIRSKKTSAQLRKSLELERYVVERYKPDPLVFPIGSRQITDAFTRAATGVFLGQSTPADAAAAFVAEVNSTLATRT